MVVTADKMMFKHCSRVVQSSKNFISMLFFPFLNYISKLSFLNLSALLFIRSKLVYTVMTRKGTIHIQRTDGSARI